MKGDEAKLILSDVHEGLCGDHSKGQNLSKRILQNVYFWPGEEGLTQFC